MRTLISFILVLLTSSISYAEVSASDAARSLVGTYKVYFTGGDVNMKAVFSIDNKLKIKVVQADPEYTEAFLNVAAPDGSYGPVALPIATVYLSTGSDEETLTYVLRLSFEKDSFVKVRYLDAISTFNDGPNDSSHVRRAQAKVFKLSQKSGKFFPIK